MENNHANGQEPQDQEPLPKLPFGSRRYVLASSITIGTFNLGALGTGFSLASMFNFAATPFLLPAISIGFGLVAARAAYLGSRTFLVHKKEDQPVIPQATFKNDLKSVGMGGWLIGSSLFTVFNISASPIIPTLIMGAMTFALYKICDRGFRTTQMGYRLFRRYKKPNDPNNPPKL